MKAEDSNATDLASDLINLLHRGATEEEFALRLVRVEALSVDAPQKSTLTEIVRMGLAIRNRLDLLQQRERGMLAVTESARDLSTRLDVSSLLGAIVFRARNLLGGHLAWLSTYDPEQQCFHVLVVDGALLVGTSNMVARKHFGVASVVMATRLPFSTPDYLHDNRFPHDPELDNVFRGEGIVALVGVPLVWNEEIVGLLFVADRYHRTHTALNISILSALATHGAVAIKNAKAFEEAKSALEEAEIARRQLERHVLSVKMAADAHEEMTSLLASGASLNSLCDSVALSLGGGVVVLDEDAQVISRSAAHGYTGTEVQAFISRPLERTAEVEEAVSQSRRSGRSAIAYQAGGEVCRAVAVFGGNDVLGSILLFHIHDLDEVSIRIYERSASVIGIVLLSQERDEASKRRDVSTFLRSVVSLRQDALPVLSDQAERFGLDLSLPLSLVVIATDGANGRYPAKRLRARPELANLVLDEIDGIIVIVCGATRAKDIVHTILTMGEHGLGSTYRGVISRPVASLTEMPALFSTLQRALPILSRLGVQGHIIGQSEMALYSTLFETHDRSSLKTFLQATIGALLSRDVTRGSELATSLLVYFDNNQNATTTAQKLGIHVNTMRQRLLAIEELIGHWGSAVRALEIHMALRLWSLSSNEAH